MACEPDLPSTLHKVKRWWKVLSELAPHTHAVDGIIKILVLMLSLRLYEHHINKFLVARKKRKANIHSVRRRQRWWRRQQRNLYAESVQKLAFEKR